MPPPAIRIADRLRAALAPPPDCAPEAAAARAWTADSPRRAAAAVAAALDPDRLRAWADRADDPTDAIRSLAAPFGYGPAGAAPDPDAAERMAGYRRALRAAPLDDPDLDPFLALFFTAHWLPAAADARFPSGSTALERLVAVARPSFAEPIRRREVETVEPRRGRPFSRIPTILDAGLHGEIVAVEVDGEPVATPTAPDLDERRRDRFRIPAPGRPRTLWPLPAKIGDTPTKDLVLLYLSGIRLSGDERRDGLLRADAYWFGCLTFALPGSVRLTIAHAAALLTGEPRTGPPPDSVRRRVFAALRLLRSALVIVNPRTGEPRTLANVDFGPGDRIALGPPAWWLARGDGDRGYRLTGALYRGRTGAGGRGRESAPGRLEDWGKTAMFLSGAEAALACSRRAGAGSRPETPIALRPASGAGTGPGPTEFLPWREVLRLAGEHVPADLPASGSLERRYNRRLAALADAGYLVPGGPDSLRAAPAGDAIEIVERVSGRGSKTRKTGIRIRASARFTEAKLRSERRLFDRRPLAGLLPAGAAADAPDDD